MNANAEKYPEIWAQMQKARAREAELLAERKPITDQIAAVAVEMEALKQRKIALAAQADASIGELREVRDRIKRLGLAMDGPATLNG